MDIPTSDVVAQTVYSFRLIDFGGNRWIAELEFHISDTSLERAITNASRFIRDYQLVPKNFTLCWRIDRHRPNSFIYIGEPK
jgi:hypothetical protein